jgi:hypothetical protein
MATGEYTETFAKYILSCRKEYDVLCGRIANGELPAGSGVTIKITIPADDIDRIRFDILAAMNGGLDGGIRTG